MHHTFAIIICAHKIKICYLGSAGTVGVMYTQSYLYNVVAVNRARDNLNPPVKYQ